MLLDWRTLGFSSEELDLLEGTPVLVRSGRRSFYSTILAPGGAFLRYDPGCLEAVDQRGCELSNMVAVWGDDHFKVRTFNRWLETHTAPDVTPTMGLL